MATLPDDLSKLKVPELKAELSKRGLPVSGLKAVLVERLQEAVKAEAAGGEAVEEVQQDAVEPEKAATVAGVVEEVPVAVEKEPAKESVDAAAVEAPASVPEPVPIKAPTPAAEPPTVHYDTIDTSTLPERPFPTVEREDAPPPTSSRPTPAPVSSLAPPTSPTADARKRKRTASPERPSAEALPPKKAPKSSRSKSPLPAKADVEPMTVADVPTASGEPVVAEIAPAPPSLRPAVEKSEAPTRHEPSQQPSLLPTSDPPLQPAPSAPDEAPEPTPPSKADAGSQVHPVTRALYIANLVRPFTLPQIKELVEDFGEVESFWMDAVKSHAYVVYANESTAAEAKRSLDSVVWPQGTGRPLSISHLDPSRVSALASTEDNYKQSGRPRQDLKITYSPDSPDATPSGWLYTLQDFSLSAQRPGAGPLNPASAAGRLLAVQMGGAIAERPRGLASAVPQSAQSVGGQIGAQARASMADRQREGMQRDLVDSRDRFAEGSRALPPHMDQRSLPLDPGVKMRRTKTLPSLEWAPVGEAEAKRRMDDFERRPPVPVAPAPEPRWGGGGGRGGGGWGRGGYDGPRWSAPDARRDDGGWRGRGRGWAGPRW